MSPDRFEKADAQILVRDLQSPRPIADEFLLQPELHERIQRQGPVVRTRLHLKMDKSGLPADPDPYPWSVRSAVRTLLNPAQDPGEASLPVILGASGKPLKALDGHTALFADVAAAPTASRAPRPQPLARDCGHRDKEARVTSANSGFRQETGATSKLRPQERSYSNM